MADAHCWFLWLRGQEALIGLPLVITGVALMLGGWRVGRVCAMASLPLLGAGLGVILQGPGMDSLLPVIGGAVVLGGVGLWRPRYATILLGAVLATWLGSEWLTSLGLHEWPLWIATGLLFGCSGAVCLSYEQPVLIIVTSLEGAVLCVCGLVPIVARWPGLFDFFYSTSRSSSVFLPFVFLVPATIGCFLQVAAAHRHNAGLSQA